jgi:acyl-CoA thioesterase FadM
MAEINVVETPEDELEMAFGHTMGFPTDRCPIDYRRPLDFDQTPLPEIESWITTSGIVIGTDFD